MGERITEFDFPVTSGKKVLALGPQTKNTVCLLKGPAIYISRIHKDLSDPQDLVCFEQDVKWFLKEKPEIIACDLHPDYQSTRYAGQLSGSKFRVSGIQHHHAHIASCMAENGILNQKVIGVAFDGTGLGEGASLWGAEFLICDYRGFKRKAHLKEIPLLGSEKAIYEPYRLAWAWLFSIYGDGMLKIKIPFVRNLTKINHVILKKLFVSGFNSPLTSSAGRLFDAAASLFTSRTKAMFEAELAVESEKMACRYFGRSTHYPFGIGKKGGRFVIDPSAVFKSIIHDLQRSEKIEKIAYRFHLSVAEMIKKTCVKLRQEEAVNRVALSGGVFQNKLLLKLASDLLYKEGFEVFSHKILSANDSGISLGQAVIASFGG